MKFISFISACIMCCCGLTTFQIQTFPRENLDLHNNQTTITEVQSTTLCEGLGREVIQPMYNGITENELETLSILAYLEAGAESNQLIKYVVEVIFNRFSSGLWGDTLTDVIYAPGEFEPSSLIGDFDSLYDLTVIKRMNEIRGIVRDVYMNGSSLPERIMFFRTDYYHEWPGAVPEFAIENVYFSSSIWCEG